MDKELDFSEVFANAYRHHGFATGILLGSLDCKDWLYNYFIQIYFNHKEKNMEYDCKYFFYDEQVFVKGFYTYPIEYKINKDLIFEIIGLIDAGFFICGNWNEYYIDSKKHFEREYFQHAYMIYGYNKESKEFLSIGPTNDIHWSKFRVDFDSFLSSIVLKGNNEIYFNTYMVNEYFNNGFKVNKFKENINKYLTSCDVEIDSEPFVCHGGIKAQREYFSYLKKKINQNKIIDKESIYVLKEHKKLMLDCLFLLKTYLENDILNDMIGEFYLIEKEYSELLNTILKYEWTIDITKKERLLREISFREEQCLSEVYSCL